MGLSWSLFVASPGRAQLRDYLVRAPDRESALGRARKLCEQLGDDAKLMEALLALAHFRIGQRDFEVGRELARTVLAMAEQAKASAMLAGADFLLGLVDFNTGRFPAAREHFEHAIELFGDTPVHNYGAYFAQSAPTVLVGVLIRLGYPSTALSKGHELLAAARRSSDPNSIALVLLRNAAHHLMLRDTRMASERADEMLAIATEHEIAFGMIAATFVRGWATPAAGGAERESTRCAEVYLTPLPLERE